MAICIQRQAYLKRRNYNDSKGIIRDWVNINQRTVGMEKWERFENLEVGLGYWSKS